MFYTTQNNQTKACRFLLYRNDHNFGEMEILIDNFMCAYI